MKENKLIIFLVNANEKIGAGHLKRSISLAERFVLFEPRAKIIFAGWSMDEKIRNNLSFHYHKISKKNILSELECIDNSNIYEKVLIVDSDDKYLHDINFQSKCRACGFKTVFFTIFSKCYYDCDFLINPSILALHQNYSTSESTKKLFGPKYFIFNKAFEGRNITPRRKFSNSVFINFGNADPKNLSKEVIKYISKSQVLKNLEIHFVLGSLVQNVKEVKNIVAKSTLNIELYINTKDIRTVMNKCQLAICSPGTTYWELITLGIPSIIIPSSNREIETSKLLHDLEYAECILNFKEFTESKTLSLNLEYLIQNPHTSMRNFNQLQKLIDTEGVNNIVKMILK